MGTVNIADVVIAMCGGLAVVVGAQIGLLRQIGLSISLLVGCFAAAALQLFLGPVVNNSVAAEAEHVVFWLLLMAALLIVGLFTDMGWYFGTWISKHTARLRHAEVWLSKLAGALLAGVTTLAAFWLISTLFTKSPSLVIANQVNQSVVLNGLKDKLPDAPSMFRNAANLLNPHSLPVPFFDHEPVIGAHTPTAQVGAAVQQAFDGVKSSVVQVSGRGCGGVTNATGFVVGTGLVITNAHVVAGLSAPNIYVFDGNGHHQAWPVFFDSAKDLAVLRTANLAGAPLVISAKGGHQGQAAATLGFSSGALSVNMVTIAGVQMATGYDIYGQELVTRRILAIKGSVQAGDSGGPLVNESGEVLGVIFAKSAQRSNIGYALDAAELDQALIASSKVSAEVGTSQCGIGS